jgi:hypothetical protein
VNVPQFPHFLKSAYDVLKESVINWVEIRTDIKRCIENKTLAPRGKNRRLGKVME